MQVTIPKESVSREAYDELARKWAIPIIKDMFMGCKRFSDFVELHNKNSLKYSDNNDEKKSSREKPKNSSRVTGLSNRVLSDQLKRLEKFGFIQKEIVSTSPVKIEYTLTQMGLDLNKFLYEKVMWAIKYGVASRDDPYFRGHDIEKTFFIKSDSNKET